MAPIRRIGVIGAGAWGTALAQTAHAAGAEAICGLLARPFTAEAAGSD